MKLLLLLLYGFAITIPWDSNTSTMNPAPKNEIISHGMQLTWTHENSFVRFEITAPEKGWVAIGFNESKGLPETYLIMARVRDGFVEVTEHKVLKPGEYVPVMELDGKAMIFDCEGTENGMETRISFSVPCGMAGEYQKDLSQGSTYHFLMAYSQSDDFQHHSIMRTSQRITL